MTVGKYGKLDKTSRLFALFILVLFSGLRYGVGVDYFSYEDLFYSGELAAWIEPGFYFIMEIVRNFDNSFTTFNILISFLTISLLFFSLREYDKAFVISLSLFFFSQSGLGFYFNGIRQGMAAAIFLFSYRYIEGNLFIKYCLCILAASLIHVSSLLLLPFFFLNKFGFNKVSSLILVFLAIILNYTGYIRKYLLDILGLFDNSLKYVSNEFLLNPSEVRSGFGFLLFNVFSVIFILFLPRKIAKSDLALNANFFTAFIVLKNILFPIFIAYRFIVYLEWISFISIPMLIYYRFDFNTRYIIFFIILLFYASLFVAGLINPQNMLHYQSIYSR
ncbi:MAG: EpsG family protein [Sediminibacterium sp.]